jgi:hypothetical protein
VAGKENLFSFSYLSQQAGRLTTARTLKGMQILEKIVATQLPRLAALPFAGFVREGKSFRF